jgi:hypothetical protein
MRRYKQMSRLTDADAAVDADADAYTDAGDDTTARCIHM